MRRLWAYILLAVTALLLVGTTFVPVFTQARANIEYSNGHDLVFRISNKDADGSKATDVSFDDDTAVKEIASIFETRLEKANVSNYRVATQGFDTIKVTLSQESQTNYYMIIRYLSFNGTLALSNAKDDYVLGADFLNGEARVEEKNGYPCIVIPVNKSNSDYSALIEATKQLQTDNETQYGESQQDDEGNTTTSYFIYLWYDYQKDYDTFSQTIQGNDDYDEDVKNKIFVKFNIDQLNAIKEKTDSDYDDYISTVLNVDTDGNSSISVSEVRNAYDNARFYVNLLNASSLDYKVDLIYSKSSSSWIENVFSIGQHVSLAWSKTLIVTLASIALVALILIMYFKLGTLALGTTSIVSVYAGVAALVLFSSEFNLAGVVGLVAVAIASLASGIIYLSKIKDEAYKGRSLKKANAEAAKKSTLPIVDINVVLIITGVFAYIFGGALLRTFAAATVIGGLASLILNTIALRGLMWLATNTTSLQGNYDMFGIEGDKVPNLMAEEKQTYYGPYADKKISKNGKVVGIAAIVLLVASIAGIITFGVIGNGAVYNSGSKDIATEIFFETTDDKSTLNLTEIQSIVDNLKVYKKNGTDTEDFSKYVAENGTDYNVATFTEEGVQVNYHIYTLTLNTNLSADTKATYNDGTLSKEDKLSEVLEYVVSSKNFGDNTTVDVKQGEISSQSQPKFLGIMLAAVVSTAVSGFYLILRYRLSRGLTATIAGFVTLGIAGGIFALLRLGVSSYVAIAMPFASMIALFFAIILMNKERELVIEDKTRNNSPEARNELLAKASGIAYYPILILFVVIAYITLAFSLLGANFSTWVFMLLALATLIGFYLVKEVFPLVAGFFYGKLHGFANKPAKVRKKGSKKANAKPNKSAEPEEAVFIGINDY